MGWKGEESGLEERMSGLEGGSGWVGRGQRMGWKGVMDGLEGGKGWVGMG